MSTHRIAQWLAFSLALISAPALADPENPFLTPKNPTAEDVIVVNASAGPCEALQYAFLEPEVTVDGTQITVQLTGVMVTDPIWCVYGSRIDRVAIGSFPPGSYTVTIRWQYYNLIEWVQVTLGTVPLTIGDGAPTGEPVALPASDGFGLMVLALMLTAAAVVQVRRLRRKGA